MFVVSFMLLTGFTFVVALLVVRRRHWTIRSVAIGLVTLVVLGAGGIFLIIPPEVPSARDPSTLTRCPYDRLTWSNMRGDVAPSWQPCRRVARTQLALILVGMSWLTVMAAGMVIEEEPRLDLSASRAKPAVND